MATPPFGRVLTAMVTPFDRQGKVDYAQAKRLALALVESGTEGLVVTGTTGESPTLTHDEKLGMYKAVLEAVKGRATVIAGTTTYNTAESIELSREAEKLGVTGLLLTVPYYNKPPQDALYKHFVAIAESVSIPCLLYNVPSRTSLNMAADTTIKLSHVDNIAGVKEASEDFKQIAKIIEESDQDFEVWSGNDADTLPILAIGGYGVVSVVAHLAGRQVQQMIHAYLEGAKEEAAALHRRLLPLVNALFIVSNPIPVKHMLNTVGFYVGEPRLPLADPDAKTAEAIEKVLKNYTIDLPMKARTPAVAAGRSKKAVEQDFEKAVQLYEQNRPAILKKYKGQYIAITGGEIVDSDEDFDRLARRVIETYGDRDLFMPLVTEEYPQVVSIPSVLGA